ncbi:MAG: ATP-dependent RecD-like DNA helicase [Anaerovibrio sp.]|nr:ATP-dependent RecD-like DNA helicase [Anaerovibrio sp.]
MEELEAMTGVVENIIYSSPDGAFSVFRFKPEGQHSTVTVTVQTTAPLQGQQLELKGQWIEHPRFGSQFKALHMVISAPTSPQGIERFLASGVIEGVGKAMAARIVAVFGGQTLEIIEKQPHRLREVRGIGAKTAEKIHASYQEKAELRQVMLWLEEHEVSGIYAGRIYEKYGSFAVEVMEQNPYRLVREVDGIGFLVADNIAKGMGMDPCGRFRVSAALDFQLQKIALYGHCCIPDGQLVSDVEKGIGVPRDIVWEVMKQDLAEGLLAQESVGEDVLVYPDYLYRAERETAQRLLQIQREAMPVSAKGRGKLVAKWERSTGITLAQQQRQAVEAVLEHGLFVLTGGPGTGKTTVIRAMLDILEQQGLEILLGAPTGRAAKRLSEATHRGACTVHRMLEAGGNPEEGGSGFGRNQDEPLEADVIILDEVSMMDIVLMKHFLAAVPDGAHLILVGDVDQLPAVGPGSVLQDIIRSGVVPKICLTEVFRQSDDSTIVLNAHAINAGRLPQCSRERGSDFIFIEQNNADWAEQQIVALCKTYLPKMGYEPMYDVQVLSPMHRNACGVERLNQLLQNAMNPLQEDMPEVVNGSRSFRLGDKVMQNKNNYDKGVFNGDIGYIVDLEPGRMLVHFGEELEAEYESSEFNQLQLAYCMTVHKSQGSEYPVVVLPLVSAHYIMLQRNLLYTAVTRAKKLVILIGSKAALNTAVENDRTRKRYTLLAERLGHRL